MTKSRQEIESVFARLGIQQPQTTLPTFGSSSFGTLPGVESLLTPKAATPIKTVPTGFMQQLGYGMASPVRAGAIRLGLMDETPAPSNIGGWVGNILGNMVGWGALTALTMATFGAGAVALTGATAGTLAATAISAGTSGAIVGAYGGWAKDEGVDEVVKGAAVGAATDLAFLGAGHALRSLKATKMLKSDTLEAVAKGLDPEKMLAQNNPTKITDALSGLPADLADDVTAKVYKVAQKYNLSVPKPKYLTHQEKIAWLSDMVNNYHGKVDKQVFQPLYKMANDVYLRGGYAGGITEGKATNLSKVTRQFKKIWQKTPADETQTDWRKAEERLNYEFKNLAKKEKTFGGGIFKKRTGIKKYDDIIRALEKGQSPDLSVLSEEELANVQAIAGKYGVKLPMGDGTVSNARVVYMTPDDARGFAGKIQPAPVADVTPTASAPTVEAPTTTAEKTATQIPEVFKEAAKQAKTLSYDEWLNALGKDPANKKKLMGEIGKIKAPKGKNKWRYLWELAQQAPDIAEETPALTKKLSPVILDFDGGVVHGLENVDIAEKAGVKGVPVLVISSDSGNPAISSIPDHNTPNQLPILMKNLGVEEGKIQRAVDKATPFGEKKSLWDQIVTIEEEIRNQGRGRQAVYDKHNVSSFEELNNKLQSMYVLLDETTGEEHKTVAKEIKALKKSIAKLEYHTQMVDDLDVRRQKLIPYAEHTLGMHERGVIETMVGELIPDDPNTAKQTIAIPRDSLLKFLDKYKVRRLRDIDWKNHPQARAEFKALVKEAKRTGVSLWDIHEQHMVAPTEYERAKGMINQLKRPLATPKPITNESLAKIESKPKVTSIMDWFPRNRLSEPVFGRIRNADIQRKEFVHSYRTRLAEIIGKDNMKPFSKTAKAFREKLTLYLEDPELMNTDKVSDSIRQKVSDLRELFDILGRDEFKVEGWKDNYAPHVLKMLKTGEGRGFTPRELIPGFKLERTGEMGLEVRELDVYKLLDYYINKGSREKFYQPVFDAIDPLFGMKRKGADLTDAYKKAASQVKFHASQRAYYEQLKSRMLGMPTGIEQEFDEFVEKWVPDVAKTLLGLDSSGRYATQISAFMSELAYSGTLGYNPFAAIKNLTQQMSAVAHLSDNPLEGIDYWWKAKRMMSTKSGQELLETLNIARTGRNPKEALDLQMLSMSNIPGIGKLQKGAFKMFQWADTQNVDTSWMMKFLFERDRGFAIKEAVESAYSFTMATQYMYGVDSPLFFKGPIGQQVGMLMSWPLNFAAEIQQLGNTGEWNKAVTLLASYAFGAEALSLTGLSFRSIHPTEVAKGFLPIAMLEGEEAMSIPIRLTLAGYDGLKSLASGDPAARETAWDNFKRAARAYIPYSTQGRRILTTLEAARNDFKIHERTLLSQITNSEQGKGRLKYEMTKAESILGLIGPTTNAYNRWQNLETLAASESAYRRLRSQAIDAFLLDDYDKFVKKMTELRTRFGGKVDIQDIQQEIELRSMTNLQRRATALPEPMRAYFNQP